MWFKHGSMDPGAVRDTVTHTTRELLASLVDSMQDHAISEEHMLLLGTVAG